MTICSHQSSPESRYVNNAHRCVMMLPWVSGNIYDLKYSIVNHVDTVVATVHSEVINRNEIWKISIRKHQRHNLVGACVCMASNFCDSCTINVCRWLWRFACGKFMMSFSTCIFEREIYLLWLTKWMKLISFSIFMDVPNPFILLQSSMI